MPRTGKIGTFLAQPGNLTPGLPAPSDYVGWQGPFTPAELYTGGWTRLTVYNVGGASNSVAVTPTLASQIHAGDPTWWAFG